MHPVISLRRRWNAHRNAPQCVCWHSRSRLSGVDKDVLLGFSQFTPWRNLREPWGCHTGYRNILGSEWKLGAPGAQGGPRDLRAWFGPSNQFLLCFFSSPFFPPPPLNYKPFHPAECRTISPPLLLPFIPIWGTMRYSCPPPPPPRLLWDVTAGSIQWEIGCN